MTLGNGGSIRKEVGTTTNAEVDLKFVRAMIMVLLGGAALWIEYGHRTVTDAPTSTQLDALAAARACPPKRGHALYGDLPCILKR